MRTNILFLLQTLRTGGSERLVMDLCKNLDRDRFKCHVAAFVDGSLREEFEAAGVPSSLISIRSAKRDGLSIMRILSAYIGANGIHVVNAHHFTPFFYGFYGARRHRCRLFYTAHSKAEVVAANRYWSLIGHLMIRLSDGAIGVSPAVGEAIKNQFNIGSGKVITLTNAVNCRKFMADTDRQATRREIGFTEDDIVIGCVGNLRKDKNYPNLIKAFKLLHLRVPAAKLVIAGEGKRRNDLEDLIDELNLKDCAHLIGPRNDVPEIMKAMDIYCLCSFSEGLPLSLLEAMSAGLPVIGTNVRGIRDVVEHGRTGMLVPSNDPQKLSEALFGLITDKGLARYLSVNGREYVMKRHDYDAWIARYESLFSVNGLESSPDTGKG